MSTHAIFRVPEPHNEPVRSFAPGTPERDELRARLHELESQQLDIPLLIGGEEVRTGETFDAVMPHRRAHVLATVHKGGTPEVERAIAAAADAWHDWSRTPWEERAAVLLRAVRAARGPVALDVERRHDARPVEDRPPGGDRRGLRADRLLALQRPVHDADLPGAAHLLARRLEPARVPAARGLRLRGDAVQLHRDRRQPPDVGRVDGEHRRLEARVDRRLRGVVAREALRGGGAPARSDQPRLRLRLAGR